MSLFLWNYMVALVKLTSEVGKEQETKYTKEWNKKMNSPHHSIGQPTWCQGNLPHYEGETNPDR